MQHSSITLEVFFRTVWKLLLQRLHHSDDIRAKTCVRIRVVLDSFFRADSTLTHMTIQVTQLLLNSNPKLANLTQLRLN